MTTPALPHVIADRPDIQQNFDALLDDGTLLPALKTDRGAAAITFTAAAVAVLAVSHTLGATPLGILTGLGPGQLNTAYQVETESWTSTQFTVRIIFIGAVTGSQAFSWMAWA